MLTFLPNLIRAFVLLWAGQYIKPLLEKLVALGYLPYESLEPSYDFLVIGLTGGLLIVVTLGWSYLEKLFIKKVVVENKELKNELDKLQQGTTNEKSDNNSGTLNSNDYTSNPNKL